MPDPQPRRKESSSATALAKIALRDQVLTARRRLPLPERVQAAQQYAGLLAWRPVAQAASVALYVSVGSEPGTGPLRERLAAAGKRVLLPVLRADLDLDWAVYSGESALLSAGRGLLQPDGPLLGVDAIATCDVVIVPGLAASGAGMRLGRGGGSYDRALGRIPVGTPTVVLLYDGEVPLDVPVEPHDRPVTHARTPSRTIAFPSAAG